MQIQTTREHLNQPDRRKWPTWPIARSRPRSSPFLSPGLHSRKVTNWSLACCPTMLSSGAKFHIDHNLSCVEWYRKGKAFGSLNQKCCVFPPLFFFCSQLSLKKKNSFTDMEQRKTCQHTTSFD